MKLSIISGKCTIPMWGVEPSIIPTLHGMCVLGWQVPLFPPSSSPVTGPQVSLYKLYNGDWLTDTEERLLITGQIVSSLQRKLRFHSSFVFYGWSVRRSSPQVMWLSTMSSFGKHSPWETLTESCLVVSTLHPTLVNAWCVNQGMRSLSGFLSFSPLQINEWTEAIMTRWHLARHLENEIDWVLWISVCAESSSKSILQIHKASNVV